MELTFKKIYRRAANRSQENDDHIIQIMTYGLRPTHRSLAREQLTIRSFLRIFRHLPRTTTDWDTMRAMAYGGLQLP